MKRYFLFILLAAASLSAFAQDTIYIYSGRRVVSAHAVSQIDSISFTPPAPMIFNGHEYVDLGLPSGTLWATCNLGATSPDGFGDYYLWGMTTPMSCNEDSYHFDYYYSYTDRLGANGTSADPLAYYVNNIVDFAGSSFDAARANWGVGWQTPTDEQWSELVDNTTQRQSSINGVAGFLLTSTLNGYSIFLPTAGDYNMTCTAHRDFGGTYMTATPVTAWSGEAAPNLVNALLWDGVGFHWGDHRAIHSRSELAMSIRPVAKYDANTYTLTVESDNMLLGSVEGDGSYVEGTNVLLKANAKNGYCFTEWNDGNTENPRTITVTTDASYTASFGSCQEEGETQDMTGALQGVFSVSDTKQVRFSQGNLQYQASTDTWRFAEHQYDTIGALNSQISSTYSGWIDMFGWGTGHNPTTCSSNCEDYSSSQVDWGANAISNGGNSAGQWRTLTQDEWNYLFKTRANANSLYGAAQVNGINGYILLPDTWTLPSGLTFTAGSHSAYGYPSVNNYTTAEWEQMENAGAIFLPALGWREETQIDWMNEIGFYWSSTPMGDGKLYALHLDFGDGSVAYSIQEIRYGFPVRLCKDL